MSINTIKINKIEGEDSSNAVVGVGIDKVESISQAEYDALVAAGTVVSTTLYVIINQ